jgi:ribosomal protein S27AE
MAYKKICPNCGEASYSASKINGWKCPHCGESLGRLDTSPHNDENR